jgi:hypothetical protein
MGINVLLESETVSGVSDNDTIIVCNFIVEIKGFFRIKIDHVIRFLSHMQRGNERTQTTKTTYSVTLLGCIAKKIQT